jgi:hypothetical protein
MKKCRDCHSEKQATTEFFVKNSRNADGLDMRCKGCRNALTRAYRKANPVIANGIKKRWRDNNREKFRENERHRRAKSRARLNENTKRWRRKNPDKIGASSRRAGRKSRTTVRGMINNRMSAAIGRALKGRKSGRRWETLVGYTLDDLVAHIESKFLPGMNWGNRDKWHIDHLRPKSSFACEGPDDPAFRECWSLDNLRPLWSEDNLKKHAKIGIEHGNATPDCSSV